MTYYIIAGEASGDLHGARLVKELIAQDTNVKIRAWGGDLMDDAGAEIVRHYKDLAFMGFVEVAQNIKTILNNLKFCKADILNFSPDALILIDYPGFNLRIAKWAHQQQIPVFYYISPQIWAWNVKRVHKIGKFVDQMFVILPFEKSFYKKFGYDVTYVGHPLKEVIDEMRIEGAPTSNTIALLPGSRKQEIRMMLPVMLQLPAQFPNHQFVIAQAPGIDQSVYTDIAGELSDGLALSTEGTYPLLMRSVAAVSTSGTATLETALFKVPQIVCYKGNAISYQLAKRLIRVPYISLVNLIADEQVVPELIQSEFNIANLTKYLSDILSGEARDHQLSQYDQIHERLEFEGSPPKLVASEIIRYFRKNVN